MTTEPTKTDVRCMFCDVPAHGFIHPGHPTADTTTGYYVCAEGHDWSATWATPRQESA